MPAIAATILQAILAAINAFPQIQAVVDAGKAWISSLTTSGVFTVDQQNVLHAYVDAHSTLVKAGIVPPAWQVDPDPVPPVAASPSAPVPSPSAPQ